jgi:proliferating cell nuclear antigen PCNA
MNCQFPSTLFLIKVFSTIVDIIPTCGIRANSDGLFINCMDSSQSAIVYVVLSKDDFIYKYDQDVNICFDLKSFLNILLKLNKLDKVAINYKKGDDFLQISQFNDTKRTSNYKFKLLDIELPIIEIPQKENSVYVELDTNDLKQTLEKMLLFGTKCKISANSNKNLIQFSITGDLGSGYEQFPLITNESFIKKDISDYFNLEFMIKFMKGKLLVNNVFIGLDENYPILFNYNIGQTSKIKFYLAPMQMTEDDIAFHTDDKILDNLDEKENENENIQENKEEENEDNDNNEDLSEYEYVTDND